MMSKKTGNEQTDVQKAGKETPMGLPMPVKKHFGMAYINHPPNE